MRSTISSVRVSASVLSLSEAVPVYTLTPKISVGVSVSVSEFLALCQVIKLTSFNLSHAAIGPIHTIELAPTVRKLSKFLVFILTCWCRVHADTDADTRCGVLTSDLMGRFLTLVRL